MLKSKPIDMRQLLTRVSLACLLSGFLLVSCSDANSSPEEEKEIKSMDSVSQAVKDSTERLEEQTRKVEESLEKMEKEFQNPENK